MNKFSPRTREIIDRLAQVDLAHPALDEGAVERAVSEHLRVLGLQPRPLRWISDVEHGLITAAAACQNLSHTRRSRRLSRALGKLRRVDFVVETSDLRRHFHFQVEPGRRFPWLDAVVSSNAWPNWVSAHVGNGGPVRPMALLPAANTVDFTWIEASVHTEIEATAAADEDNGLMGIMASAYRIAQEAVGWPVISAAYFLAAGRFASTNTRTPRDLHPVARVVDFLFEASRLVYTSLGFPAPGSTRSHPHWSSDYNEETNELVAIPPVHVIEAFRAACAAAAWTAISDANDALNRSPAIERMVNSSLPLVEAHEAGLLVFCVLRQEVLAVPRPAIHAVDGRLHCSDGPAVWWPGGMRHYFWRGLSVPEQVIMRPKTLIGRDILSEPNLELRRVMIEQVGLDRFFTLLGEVEAPRPIHADKSGELYRIPLEGDEPLVMVCLTDPSTGRRYFLRVPPDIETARDAVAWTFEMDPEDWDPTLET